MSLCETLSDRPTWTKQYENMRPDAIFYQWYPYYTDSATVPVMDHSMVVMLDTASNFCKSKGIGFFITRGSSNVRRPAFVFRPQTYLAHGVNGFMDWMYDNHAKRDVPENKIIEDSTIDENGKEQPTRLFEAFAKVNREAVILGEAIRQLRRVRTYNYDYPTGNHWSGRNCHFSEKDELRTGKILGVTKKSQPNGVPTRVLVAFFQDANKEEWFFVVNKKNTRNAIVDDAKLGQAITFR